MNQEKIGKFISECRKEKQLTQEQLAMQLGVTSKLFLSGRPEIVCRRLQSIKLCVRYWELR